MTESTMFADLLAAQKEMPNLQKSAINPHFGNKFVPLEELLQTVLPILNAHNFVLLQMPGYAAGGTATLQYELLHASGEKIQGEMLLLCAKDDPQGQGSAITYARRYSLMSLLGLTADIDDDAETTRKNGQQPAQRPAGAVSRPTQGRDVDIPHPTCPEHNVRCNLVPAGTSKASGKPYSSFFACPQKGCGQNGKSWTIFADKWSTDWMMEHNREPAMSQDEMAELPFE